jgi:hypothetical protein
VVHLSDKKLVFDHKDKVLIDINGKCSKRNLLKFKDRPESPANLYAEIKQVLKKYVEFLKEAYYGLIAAWIIATYFHRCFNAFPFLDFLGRKECGKTRTLNLLERLAFNAIKVKHITAACLGDTIEGVRGTLLVDQAEALSDPNNAELLGILADSYTPEGGRRRVIDFSNKRRRIIEFETYSPKAFASTKDLDNDLKDRCISIPMVRSRKDYPYPEAHLEEWKYLRDKLYRFLLTKWKEVKEIYKKTGKDVTHRVRELWMALETILILEEVPDDEFRDIKTVFLESMIETQSELDDRELQLFQALNKLLGKVDEDILTVTDIARRIEPGLYIAVEEAEKPLEVSRFKQEQKRLETWVGKKLSQMSLYTKRMGRKEGKRAYLFNRKNVEEVYGRYQPSGLSGEVAEDIENNGSVDTTSKTKREKVVNLKTFRTKGKDHVTTYPTSNGMRKTDIEKSLAMLRESLKLYE